ncbi:hypothetical protein HHI36_020383 [Cryptolaemus montrouzieri]|uniref:Kazal-like domain-containing protein n=1 Tax=Cryptolaemus montrouzieri TaxID=559131 RepID=A0ABD2NB51_9CUCU
MATFTIVLFVGYLIGGTIAYPSEIAPPAAIAANQTTSADVKEDDAGRCNIHCGTLKNYEPICGEDGRTYPNKSSLFCRNECAKLQGSSEVKIAHAGVCAPNESTTSSTSPTSK